MSEQVGYEERRTVIKIDCFVENRREQTERAINLIIRKGDNGRGTETMQEHNLP